MVLGILRPDELSAQTYQERRNAILDKQNETRSEIEELSKRIREFEQQINANENEYSKIFQQYEQLNKMIALQDNKIRSLEGEQYQIVEEVNLIKDQIQLREKELQKSLDNYREIMRYTYINGRLNSIELLARQSLLIR